MQGGIDPELPGTAYFDLASAVKSRRADMHVHAFSARWRSSTAQPLRPVVRDWLVEARRPGSDSIPGTAAEILDDEVRWVLTKGKLPTSDLDRRGHHRAPGGPAESSSTMMYGHVDTPAHWVAPPALCSVGIQDETGGFTEFVPLPFVHTNAPIYLAGVARPGPTLRDNVAVHAVARILLHGRIDNIQTSWVKLGVDGTQAMLARRRQRPRRHADGGDDLADGRLRARLGQDRRGAGRRSARRDGRPVAQRTTTYGPVPAERRAAATLADGRLPTLLTVLP